MQKVRKKQKLHPVTIRLKSEDIETFKEEAERRALSYQALIRSLVHEGAEEIRKKHQKPKGKSI